MATPVKSSAGKKGDQVRSDCFIELEQTPGRSQIQVNSKVKSLYGASIAAQVESLAALFALRDISITVEDYGALPFSISARFEAAVKRMFPDCSTSALPDMLDANETGTTRDRLRRSRLYLPGNEPKFFINAGLHKPDGIILDLEDSVSPSEKDTARLMVRNALRAVDFYGCERMVRINQLPMGLDDLREIVPQNPNIILLPKCENAGQVQQVNEAIKDIQTGLGMSQPVFIMPIIESAMGVLKALEIAQCENVCALAVGLEDYTADIGTQRTNEGRESFFARSMVINAAKAAGVQAIDTVFSDVSDMEALRQSVIEAKALGFEGKGCIHPRQVEVVHQAMAPAAEEIDKAKKIVLAFRDAEAKGLGVVALGTKMIDPPVVKRAVRTIDLAILTGLLPASWDTESESGK